MGSVYSSIDWNQTVALPQNQSLLNIQFVPTQVAEILFIANLLSSAILLMIEQI